MDQGMIRELTEGEVTFTVNAEPEHCTLEGSFCSGNAKDDAETIRAIRADLESGNEWAWCTVEVTATWEGWNGSEYLGACSYKSREDFMADCYYADMKERALAELNAIIAQDAEALGKLLRTR
jgi:hypothetical protein